MAEDQSRRAGLLFGVGAYLVWGVLPLYFKLLAGVSPTEIVAHRIVWSLVFLAALATLWRRWPAIRAAATTSRGMLTLAVTALLIAINWLIYIWAVINGHVLEGSLGYYLNPLVNVLLGVVILKERLTRGQLLAVLLAGLGVSVLAVQAAAGLWISLALALRFGLYGFIRKIAPVDALEGLAIETAVLAPVSLGYVLWLQQQGIGGVGRLDAATHALLILGGAGTPSPPLLPPRYLLRRDLGGALPLRGRGLPARPRPSPRGRRLPGALPLKKRDSPYLQKRDCPSFI